MTTQKKKNKERHKQDIHKTYKSHETYGKHPSSLVLNETHVKYDFLFITLVKYWIFFLKKSTKYLDREFKTGIFIHLLFVRM